MFPDSVYDEQEQRCNKPQLVPPPCGYGPERTDMGQGQGLFGGQGQDMFGGQRQDQFGGQGQDVFGGQGQGLFGGQGRGTQFGGNSNSNSNNNHNQQQQQGRGNPSQGQSPFGSPSNQNPQSGQQGGSLYGGNDVDSRSRLYVYRRF